MKNNFKKSLALTLVYEGGYVDDPHDPGGATMKGVTQAVYDAYRRKKNRETQPIRLIRDGELQDIYKTNYWDQASCDDLPAGVDFSVFDYAVHSGVKRAVSDLQRGVGCNTDGVAGLATVAAVERADAGAVVADVNARRLAFLRSLKTWPRYGGGWGRRVTDVAAQASAMVTAVPVDAPAEEAFDPSPRAPEAAQALMKTKDGTGLTIGGTGAAGQTLMQAADQVKPHFSDTPIGRLAIAAFVILMIVGGALLVTSYIRRIKEKGGLGGFIGSLGQ
jgi:lysozyme family protein